MVVFAGAIVLDSAAFQTTRVAEVYGPMDAGDRSKCARTVAPGTRPGRVGRGTPLVPREGHELAVFAQGCFWSVEERFRQVPGVVATAVGYTGGRTVEPTYEQVCGHGTGHAEAVLVEFDPGRVSYATLLDLFWRTHDPTKGGDQYRSAAFTFSDAQLALARETRDQVQARLGLTVTTELAPAGPFWLAEESHQQWVAKGVARR